MSVSWNSEWEKSREIFWFSWFWTMCIL